MEEQARNTVKEEKSQSLSILPSGAQTPAVAPFNVRQMLAVAKASAASGFYKDAKDANKALVKMMIGHELGIGPGASLSGIYVVQDKIVLSANLLAALIKRSGHYDYRVLRLDDEGCILEFYSVNSAGKRESLGKSEFLKSHAEKAGLMNKPGPWKAFPRNMFFARALTNGQRWHCPDLTAGSPVYTPDELGLAEDEEGNIAAEPLADAALAEKLRKLCEESGSPPEKLLQHYGVGSFEDMTEADANAAVKILEQRLALRRQQQQAQQQQQQTTQTATPVRHADVVEPEEVTK